MGGVAARAQALVGEERQRSVGPAGEGRRPVGPRQRVGPTGEGRRPVEPRQRVGHGDSEGWLEGPEGERSGHVGQPPGPGLGPGPARGQDVSLYWLTPPTALLEPYSNGSTTPQS